MSEREIAQRLLEDVPQYKLGYVIAYLQGITADEAEDDLFCQKLVEEYEASDDKGDLVTLEETAKLCGINLDEI